MWNYGLTRSATADLDQLTAKPQLGGQGPVDYGFGGGGDDSRPWRVPGRAYRTGVWLFIAALIMMFTGFTSAFVVRQSSANDWGHTAIPHILYLNTLLLMASSVTLEFTRRLVARTAVGLQMTRSFEGPLYLTLGLGLLFVGGQLMAWHTLVLSGTYLATNPSASTFYVLTGIHGLHLLGGIVILAYLVLRSGSMPVARFRACLGAASTYWHFMGLLWLYILILLAVRF